MIVVYVILFECDGFYGFFNGCGVVLWLMKVIFNCDFFVLILSVVVVGFGIGVMLLLIVFVFIEVGYGINVVGMLMVV